MKESVPLGGVPGAPPGSGNVMWREKLSSGLHGPMDDPYLSDTLVHVAVIVKLVHFLFLSNCLMLGILLLVIK